MTGKFIKKYRFILLLLLTYATVTAQLPQKKLDSLQNVLMSINKQDTARIASFGSYIISNTSSKQQKFEILQEISRAYMLTNNTAKSVSYLFKAKNVAEQLQDPLLLAQTYGSIANQYSYLNLTDKARSYLTMAMREIDKLPSGNRKHTLKALSYIELGNLDFNNREYPQANKNYRRSLEEFNVLKSSGAIGLYHKRRSLYNIGNSYYYMKKTDSAEIYLNKALALKDPQNPNLKYYIYSTLAEVYTANKNHKQAIDTLQAVLHDKNFDISSLKTEMYLNLAQNYRSMGDTENYTFYNEKYLALSDAVKSKDLEAINTVLGVEHADLSSSLVQQKWQLLYFSAAVFVAGLIVFFYLKRKRRNEKSYKSIIKTLSSQVAAYTSLNQETETKPEPEIGYSVPFSVEKEILNGLIEFESAEGFRNPQLTLPMLAVQLKTNPAYVSAVINSHKHKNFNSYINELRIHYSCRKIHSHPEYQNYKISYLAEDSGFVSHGAFSTIFKKVTGISPSVFLRQAAKGEK